MDVTIFTYVSLYTTFRLSKTDRKCEGTNSLTTIKTTCKKEVAVFLFKFQRMQRPY